LPLRLGVVPFFAAGLAFGFAPLPVAAFLLAGAALLLAAHQTNGMGTADKPERQGCR
jgi:hypothetical protein